jgi:hypothetical protein
MTAMRRIMAELYTVSKACRAGLPPGWCENFNGVLLFTHQFW